MAVRRVVSWTFAVLLLISTADTVRCQQTRNIDSRLAQIDSFMQGSVTYVKFFKPLYQEGSLDTFTYIFEREKGKTVRFCLLSTSDSLSFVAQDSQFLSLNGASRTYRRYDLDALSAMPRLGTKLPSIFAHKLNPARELLLDSRTTVETTTVSRDGERLWAITHKLFYPSPEDSDYVLRQVSYYLDSAGTVRGDETLDSLWGTSLIQAQWILKFDRSLAATSKIDSVFKSSSGFSKVTSPGSKLRSQSRGAKIEDGAHIGSLSIYDSNGIPQILESPAQSIRVLSFWYAGCGPCHQLRPYFNDLQRKYAGRVEIVGVNPLDSLYLFRKAIRSQRHEYRNVLAPGLAESLDIVSYPTTVVLSKQGVIVWHAKGLPAEKRRSLESAISKEIDRND